MASFVQPNRSAIHTDVPLTNIMIAFFQEPSHFIANTVFPTIPVNKSSNQYFLIPRGNFNRLEVQKRARGAGPATMTYDYARDTYNAEIYALSDKIADEDRDDADSPITLDSDSTALLMGQARLNREIDWTTKFFVASVWTNDRQGVAVGPVTGTSFLQWNDAASLPIEDIHLGKTTVLALTGFEPNTLVLGYEVFNVLQDHQDIIDRVKYGQTPGAPAMATEVALAQLFGVARVLISKAIQNTSEEGAADAHSFIMGKEALLTYVTPRPGMKVPTAGYTFAWSVYSSEGMRIRRFRDDRALVDEIIMDDAFDQKLVAADLGYFFIDAIA